MNDEVLVSAASTNLSFTERETKMLINIGALTLINNDTAEEAKRLRKTLSAHEETLTRHRDRISHLEQSVREATKRAERADAQVKLGAARIVELEAQLAAAVASPDLVRRVEEVLSEKESLEAKVEALKRAQNPDGPDFADMDRIRVEERERCSIRNKKARAMLGELLKESAQSVSPAWVKCSTTFIANIIDRLDGVAEVVPSLSPMETCPECKHSKHSDQCRSPMKAHEGQKVDDGPMQFGGVCRCGA